MKIQKGFSLLELMIVCAIIGIFAAAAAPPMKDAFDYSRRTSHFYDLHGALASTRMEAISKNTTVTICPSVDRATCDGSAWQSGYIIFTDTNADRVINASGDPSKDADVLIRSYRHENVGNLTIVRTMANGAADTGFVQYASNALLEDTTNAGNFTICDDNGANTATGIVMNSSGQTRWAVDTNADTDSIREISVNNVAQNMVCP